MPNINAKSWYEIRPCLQYLRSEKVFMSLNLIRTYALCKSIILIDHAEPITFIYLTLANHNAIFLTYQKGENMAYILDLRTLSKEAQLYVMVFVLAYRYHRHRNN